MGGFEKHDDLPFFVFAGQYAAASLRDRNHIHPDVYGRAHLHHGFRQIVGGRGIARDYDSVVFQVTPPPHDYLAVNKAVVNAI